MLKLKNVNSTPETNPDNFFEYTNNTGKSIKKDQVITLDTITGVMPTNFITVAYSDIPNGSKGYLQIFGTKIFEDMHFEEYDNRYGSPIWYNDGATQALSFMPSGYKSFIIGHFVSYNDENNQLKVNLNNPHNSNERYVPYYNDTTSVIYAGDIVIPNSDPNQDMSTVAITDIKGASWGFVQYSGIYVFKSTAEFQNETFGCPAYWDDTTKTVTNLTKSSVERRFVGMYIRSASYNGEDYGLVEINKFSNSKFDTQKKEEKVTEIS